MNEVGDAISESTDRITVDVHQIAEIAGVGRSAVANWRKRHARFPVPDASGRFDLREIESWLIENGRLDQRVPARVVAWALADRLRSSLTSHQITRLLVSVLVYLEACERAVRSDDAVAPAPSVVPAALWDRVRRASPDGLAETLRAAAAQIEDANPILTDLLVPGLAAASSIEARSLTQLVDSLDAAAQSSPRLDLFEDVIGRASDLDRFRGWFSTPDAVTKLMICLAEQDGGSVVDLACGEGGLLLSAALWSEQQTAPARRVAGYEINEEALRIARARFFLHGVDVELHKADALRVPTDDLPRADLVLLDPPLGLRDWGDAALYVDDRWAYGMPPPNNADLAWVQLALRCLAEGGRALVVTANGAAFRGGGEARIRTAMLEAGVIEAVVQLPGRMRGDTSIPLLLWVLSSPGERRQSLLFVDASALGTTGRSQHSFAEEDIERIAAAVRAGVNAAQLDPDIAWVVGVDTVIDNEAVLDPARYRPAVEVDFAASRGQADDLRRRLPRAAGEAEEAVQRLLGSFSAEEELTAHSVEKALSEVAAVLHGTLLVRAAATPTDDSRGLRFFGADEIESGGTGAPRFVDAESLASGAKHPVRLLAGDVVIASTRRGARSALVDQRDEGAVLCGRCVVIRPTVPELTGAWIYAWIRSAGYADQAARHRSGTTLPRLSPRALLAFRIPVPPLERQTQAAQMLELFDSAIVDVDQVRQCLADLRALEIELLFAGRGEPQ